MAGILGQVLTGIGRGALDNVKEARKKREEDATWQTEKKRKGEMLDMEDEYKQKSEKRSRSQKAIDDELSYQREQKREDAAYSKQKSRLAELQNQQLAEVQKLFPDAWNNPTLQPQIVAGIKGIKVPALPANKQIASLAMAGKIDEALKLAIASNNPEDRKFYDDMIDTITKQKRLKELLNPTSSNDQQTYGFKPEPEFVQSALDQGNKAATGMLSKFIPGMETGSAAMPTMAQPQKPKPPMDEKTVKQYKQVRDDAAREISMIRQNYKEDLESMKGTADEFRYQDAIDRYNKAAAVVNEFSNSVLNGQQNQPVQMDTSSVVQSFLELNKKFLDAGKRPEKNIVKRSEAKQ